MLKEQTLEVRGDMAEPFEVVSRVPIESEGKIIKLQHWRTLISVVELLVSLESTWSQRPRKTPHEKTTNKFTIIQPCSL